MCICMHCPVLADNGSIMIGAWLIHIIMNQLGLISMTDHNYSHS